MLNQKIKNIELLNKNRYRNFNAEEWASVILGIRKSLKLSQTRLSEKLNICRQSISRFEALQRKPNEESISKILNFIKENNLNMSKLKDSENNNVNEYKTREKLTKLELKHSSDLAELIGIILGDGEIKKDGNIRISFDPKKDKNFIYRRVFVLVDKILNLKPYFESYKRISFYNIAFVRYLKENCKLNPGSKFENNWEIPKWCFEDEEYLKAVIRGIFDTDGYIGYCNGTIEIMFGRFSVHSTNLIQKTEQGLKKLNFNPIVKYSPDRRCKIRIFSKKDVIKFMNLIGSSNIKHIVRYLLWRLKGYPAKIEKEGLSKLVGMINSTIKSDINKINLPYLWNPSNFSSLSNFKQDDIFVKTKIIVPKRL